MSQVQPTATRMIGYYKKRNTTAGVDISVQEFLDGIATGKWRQHVDWVREAQDDKAEYDRRKTLSECVTIGGTFDGPKTKENLREASGLMAVDLDALLERVESFRQLLSQDPYVYAVFKSIGGQGLCPIFRIDPARWDESFVGISDYLITTYGLVGKQFDPSSSNINRLRYVSYDPDIHVNDKAKLFAKYPRKERKQPKPQAFVHTQSDIQHIIDQINVKALDITGSYNDWYRIGWALISEYGEDARDLFQQVSQYHPEYDADECDKKFRYLVATRPSQIRIATFYWYCKQAGLDIMTPRTKEIVSVAAMGKKQKISQGSAVDMVGKRLGVPAAEAAPIVEQVYAASEAIDTQETMIDQLELFLKQNHPMRYNVIRRDFEDIEGKPVEDHHYYAIYMSARRVLGDKVRYEDLFRLIHSRTVYPEFHPFLTFFQQHKTRKPTGIIQALADSIESDTGFGEGEFEPRYVYTFLRKWLVGLIGAIYGEPCDLVPVLTGADGVGKTWFFRHLLPPEWKAYFLESKWLPGKDEDVDMCKHLIAFNDEFKGRDNRDMEHFKALTSKEFFSVREVYARKSVKLRRLAVLCATSNHKGVINEPEHNRRIIPINVLSIDHEAYNAIDKTDLIMESWHAYQAGERQSLSRDERRLLGSQTEEFQNKSLERQLIEQYLALPTDGGGELIQWKSTIDLIALLELKLNNRKLNDRQLGRELTACGFIRKQKRVKVDRASCRQWGYDVVVLE